MDDARILAEDLASKSKFYTTAADHTIRLLDGFRRGKTHGETTYYKSLDRMLRLRPGFLYAFTGWPGGGKSEFITQLSVIQAHFKKRKIAYYSPESYPEDEFLDTFIHTYLGKSTDRKFPNVCSEEEYVQAIRWCDNYFHFCNWDETPNAETLLTAFNYLADNGCTIFVVDPFNSVVTEGEERNIAISLKKNLTLFKRFAVKRRVMVWLVEHPRTAASPEEYDELPNNRNMFGGTMWWNKCDVGVTIHRPNRQDHEDRSVVVNTWKVKRQQLNGTPGEATLYFDLRSNRYFEDRHCLSHPMIETDVYRDDRRDNGTPF